ncbi:lipase family protein [Rhodococcus erythropolis]
MSSATFRRLVPLVALTVALVLPATAGAEVPDSDAPKDVQTPVSEEFRTDTPTLGEVFNGFTVGALSSGEFASEEEIFTALTADDPFYDEPVLTGAERPGDLLKSKKVDVLFTGYKPGQLDAYKIMYVTTGIDGSTPVVSTGIMMIPIDGTPASEKKIISYQEANDSVGGYCHPSSHWTGGDPLDGASWSALGPLALMFGKGYAVVISDVGNNRDRDPHGVFAGKFAGHAQLDAVRAAFQLQDSELNPDAEIALFGIAGGGVGSAFAAESAQSYAPELDIVSTVLEGMVIKPRTFMETTDSSVGAGFGFATLLGLEPWYPEMKLNDKLNPVGRAIADVYRGECQMPAYFTLPFVPLASLFAPGIDPITEPSFQRAYDDNVLGHGAPASKVLITSCAKDDSPMSLVPAADARELADTYRSRGTDVSYQPTDCSMDRAVADPYGWGTDLFGMQTIDWIAHNFDN